MRCVGIIVRYWCIIMGCVHNSDISVQYFEHSLNIRMRSNYHNQPQEIVTKISRSKSRNQMSIASKIKEKESGWNDRFHLEHIPEYNYQNQPHSQYLKNKFRLPTKKNEQSKPKQRQVQPSLDKNKVSNKPNMLRNEEKLKEAINKAFADLKTLWYQKFIPECHMELMTKIFNRQNNPMKILEDIKHEFSQINKEISLIQKITTSVQQRYLLSNIGMQQQIQVKHIQLRESCLQKIIELINELESNPNNEMKISRLFEERISHLRILTIHCIECIYQWKQSIEPQLIRGLKAKFTYNGKSYIQKMLEDTRMIASSSLRRLFQFDSKKEDLFFLNYSNEGKKTTVPKSNLKRIRLCEIMLLQQSEKEEGNASKTPQRQDKSVPPQMIKPSWKKVEIDYNEFVDFFNESLSSSAFSHSFLSTIDIPRYQELTVFRHSQATDEVILGVERNSSQRKLFILSLKASLHSIEANLPVLCNYLWMHDNCSEIRISLLHLQQQEGYMVDGELQKRLKAVGFRWVSVNHAEEVRLTTFGIKRPLDIVAYKTARRKQAYPVIVEHLTVLSLAESNERKVPTKCIVALIKLIEMLKESNHQLYHEICLRDEFSHVLDCMNRIAAHYLDENAKNTHQNSEKCFTYSGLKPFLLENPDMTQKIFRNIQISLKKIPPLYPCFISLMNSSFKFKNVTITQEKFTKFLPNKDNQILICQSNYPIYLLQSDEENINFFIIQVEQTFSMEAIDSIFHAMGEQSSFIDDFWLPVFHKSTDYIDQVAFRNSEIVSTDYWSCLGSLKRKPNKKRTKIIKAPFVFGMIHKRLLEILQIPFYCTLVRKDDLL